MLKCNEIKDDIHFTVINPTGYNVRFAASTDVNGLEGNPFINVSANGQQKYKIRLKGLQRGEEENKKIVFTAQNISQDDTGFSNLPEDHALIRLWYKLNIQTLPGDASEIFELSCPVQHEKTKIIELENKNTRYLAKLETESNFYKIKEGIIENEVEINFSPQMPGFTSARIVLTPIDVNLPEIWYEVNGQVLPPAPKVISNITAPLGEKTSEIIWLTNPTDSPMPVKLSLEPEKSQFVLREKELLVPPQQKVPIEIDFYSCDIGFVTGSSHGVRLRVDTFDVLGTLLFDLEGFGTTPKRREPKAIYGSAGVSEPGMVIFQNPTCYNVQATVRLNQQRIDENCSEFILLVSQKTVYLEPKGILEIPFCFIQNENSDKNTYVGSIEIEVRKESGTLWDENNDTSMCLNWKYPIVGFKKNSMSTEKLSFSGNVGQIQESYLAVSKNTSEIHQGSNNLIIGENFCVQRLTSRNEFYLEDVDLSEISFSFDTGIEIKEDIKMEFLGVASVEEKKALIFKVIFSPKFPLISSASILISGKDKFAYEIPVVLEARDDNIDAIIDLNAEQVLINQTFKIPYIDIDDSGSETGVKFDSWLEQSSNIYEILEKRSRSILINFTPTKYGTVFRGHLFIEKTDKFGMVVSRKRCALRGWAGPNSAQKDERGRRKSVVKKSDNKNVGEKRKTAVLSGKIRTRRDFINENKMLLTTAACSQVKGLRLTQ